MHTFTSLSHSSLCGWRARSCSNVLVPIHIAMSKWLWCLSCAFFLVPFFFGYVESFFDYESHIDICHEVILQFFFSIDKVIAIKEWGSCWPLSYGVAVGYWCSLPITHGLILIYDTLQDIFLRDEKFKMLSRSLQVFFDLFWWLTENFRRAEPVTSRIIS